MIGKQVRYDGKIWTVISQVNRNIAEPLDNVVLIGDVLHIRNNSGHVTAVYPWDVWGLESWENIDGTLNRSLAPNYLLGDI